MKYYLFSVSIFFNYFLFNMANAQDTIPLPKWCFNSMIGFPELGIGYFLDGRKVFTIAYNFNHVISKKNKIYGQVGIDGSVYQWEPFGGIKQRSLGSVSISIGKMLVNHKSFLINSFIGPSYVTYAYNDVHYNTIISNTIGLMVSSQLNTLLVKSKDIRAGIALELSANINKNMSVIVLRIATPIMN